MYKIMVVDDNATIREKLCRLLSQYGYETATVEDFNGIEGKITAEAPDLVLLDINLPSVSGFHICQALREKSTVPIIFVTSRDSNMDEVMSMTVGGDDFITKPYDPEVLAVRIAAVLRRSYRQKPEILEYRGLRFNMAAGIVHWRENEAELTKNEGKVLHILLENRGHVVSREELMNHLWNDNVFLDDNTLTVNVNRLRKKLEEIGVKDMVATKRGQGYIIV